MRSESGFTFHLSGHRYIPKWLGLLRLVRLVPGSMCQKPPETAQGWHNEPAQCRAVKCAPAASKARLFYGAAREVERGFEC